MKKAFLVSFTPMTRVIVDVPEDFLSDEFESIDEFVYAKIVAAARERIIENGISDYLNGETVDSVELDEEMPYEEGE